MGLIICVGVFIVLYHVISFLLLWVFDCDLSVAWCERFGSPLSVVKSKVVWITGASSGIGEALAYEVAKHGGRMVISARRAGNLEKVKSHCLKLNPQLSSDDILILPFDVTDYSQHKISFDKILSHFGHIDIFVQNAGRSQRAKWEEIEIDVDREIFDVNVFSGIALARLVVRHFNERGKGQIAVTSSLARVFGVPGSASYTATKHALHGYYECLRNEKPNVKVTIICPGPTFSEFLQESFTHEVKAKYGIAQSPTDSRMSSKRCAELCLVAIVNNLPEAWISVPPFLPLISLIRFYPNFARFIMSPVLKVVRERRDG